MSTPALSLEYSKRLIELLRRLFAGYGKEASSVAMQAYIEALEDLSPGQLEFGFHEAIKRIKFFPTPSEVREIAKEIPAEGSHPVECKICDGMGYVYSPLLKAALPCSSYVKFKAEMSVIADEMRSRLESGRFEVGPLQKIPIE